MHSVASKNLFDPTMVFVTKQTTQKEIFKEVSDQLLAKQYVKPAFFKNLWKREQDYPTGIDMSVANSDYPNVAIPHTAENFVNVSLIVPIKLVQPVAFGNMIEPNEKLSVSFLFMLLNNDPDNQTNILSEIMDFLTSTPAKSLEHFFQETDRAAIYSFLNTFFNQK